MTRSGSSAEVPEEVVARPARYPFPSGGLAQPPPLSTLFVEQLGEIPTFPVGDPSMMFLPVGPTLGGVNTSMLHMASPLFREKIGFPPGDAGGPLLWHVDSPSGDG